MVRKVERKSRKFKPVLQGVPKLFFLTSFILYMLFLGFFSLPVCSKEGNQAIYVYGYQEQNYFKRR